MHNVGQIRPRNSYVDSILSTSLSRCLEGSEVLEKGLSSIVIMSQQ